MFEFELGEFVLATVYRAVGMFKGRGEIISRCSHAVGVFYIVSAKDGSWVKAKEDELQRLSVIETLAEASKLDDKG